MAVSSVDDMAQQYAALEQQRQQLNQRQQARTVYLIRHGSTELNDEHDCIRGWKNVPLSNKGWNEAFELAKKMKATNVGIIFTSDLDRSVGTANAIASAIHAQIIKTELLRPWNLGNFTGKPFKQVHDDIVKFAEKTPTLAVPGGESFNDFRIRAFNGLRFALSNSRGQAVALVTHHRVERLFTSASPDGSVVNDAMFNKGEPPATSQKVTVDLAAIAQTQPTSAYAGPSVIGPNTISAQ